MADIIQIRRDTAANWTTANPILAQGEFGVETDTLKLKIGDGASPWTGLRYYRSEDSYTAGDGISIQDFVVSNTGVRSLATGSANGTIKVNGTTDVSVKGLGSAAYTASNAYATAAQGTKADNAADKNLSNLTSTGANIANWSHNVANCIIEIPQDINLTLSSGTLTLKTGSKVYIPNGSGVFDSYTLPSDKGVTPSQFSTSTGRFVILDPNKNLSMVDVIADYIYSGTTAPTTFDGNGRAYWYDTTNNVIKRTQNSGTTWLSGYSLPVAIVDITNGVGVSKIDQVFNGFGYIGSTEFVLPGVKGLVPNGRNVDGTLNNTAFSITQVKTATYTTDGTYYIRCATNYLNFFTSTTKYDPVTNYNIYNNANQAQMMAGTLTISGGRITSFNPKTPFHAVDYNDTDFIAHQPMPSKRYISLTLGSTSPLILTAPADGYFALSASFDTASTLFIYRSSTPRIGTSIPYTANAWRDSCLFVSKGDSVTFQFSGTPTVYAFYFIYANGAK